LPCPHSWILTCAFTLSAAWFFFRKKGNLLSDVAGLNRIFWRSSWRPGIHATGSNRKSSCHQDASFPNDQALRSRNHHSPSVIHPTTKLAELADYLRLGRVKTNPAKATASERSLKGFAVKIPRPPRSDITSRWRG